MKASRAFQALLVIAALLLSGCSAGTTDETQAESGVKVVGEEKARDGKRGGSSSSSGAGGDDAAVVKGTVLNDEGFPIARALVTIFSLSNSVETSANGTFMFEGVSPGKQEIRVEKDGFETAVKEIEVAPSSVVNLEAILIPLDNLQPMFRTDHVHDFWRDSDRYTFFDDTLEWYTSDDDEIPPEECAYGLIASHDWCRQIPVAPERGRLIPPGTRALEITMSWAPELDESKPTLWIFPPTDPHDSTTYHQSSLKSGETVVVDIDPLYADHGHNHYSEWAFIVERNEFGIPQGSTYNSMREVIDLSIIALKGEIPLDPPHPRYWVDNDTVVLPPIEQEQFGPSPQHNQPPREPGARQCNASNRACLKFNEGGIVPPGTTRLDVVFSYSASMVPGRQSPLALPDAVAEPAYDEAAYEYVLCVKGAKQPRLDATWENYSCPEPTHVEPHPDGYGRVVHYAFDVANDHGADQFYNKRSSWVFMLTAEGEGHETDDELEMCPFYVCGDYTVRIDAVALNENREEQIKAGEA